MTPVEAADMVDAARAALDRHGVATLDSMNDGVFWLCDGGMVRVKIIRKGVYTVEIQDTSDVCRLAAAVALVVGVLS